MTTYAYSAATSTINGSRRLKVVAPVGRETQRKRDFGVGYGTSSGYASGRRYTSDWSTPRFRMT